MDVCGKLKPCYIDKNSYLSKVAELPPGFSHRTLLLAGSGVTTTMERYGALVMRLAGTKRDAAMKKDLVVNSLGYWTDSGEGEVFRVVGQLLE